MRNRYIKIAIVDFPDFFKEDFILSLLPSELSFVIDVNQPDFVLYSTFGTKHLKYKNSTKLLINTESYIPDFNDCDYSISTVDLDVLGRSLWIPAGFWYTRASMQMAPEITREAALSRKFCIFLYSQDYYGEGALYRKKFCECLMQRYKFVECPGKVLHNYDAAELSGRLSEDWPESKRSYFSKFKFSIAFENMNLPGYITEKLVDCYMANTVPIYWGSSKGVSPFPKESMICANDFTDIDELIDYIRYVDQNDDVYMDYIKANPLRENCINRVFLQRLQSFVLKVIEENRPLFKNTHPLSMASYCQRLTTGVDGFFHRAVSLLRRLIKR